MASYYPEGECYFVRSSLRYHNHWTADNQDQFYRTVLLEYNWNEWRDINQTAKHHPRSQWRHGTASGYRTRFGDWDRFWVGESRDRSPDNMLRIHTHPNSLNWNECRDLDRNGPRKYILRPVRIEDPGTQWLWIDATIPLRAIYFPVSQRTDQAFPHLCTYVVIDFRHRNQVEMMNLVGELQRFTVTSHNGLGWRDDITWGFNLSNIIAYLTIPHKLRNPEQGLFRTKYQGDELVVCASSSRTWRSNMSTLNHGLFLREMDFANILSATFGVEVGWRPYQYNSWIRNMLVSLVELGLGFVPVVGPLLSFSFGMAVQLLQDPGSFSHDNILDLNMAILESLLQSGGRSQKYLAPDWLAECSCGGQQRNAPLTDEERARRREIGEEINDRLTDEMDPQPVIRSLLEQEQLFNGGVDRHIEEVKDEEVTDTAQDRGNLAMEGQDAEENDQKNE